MESKVPWYILLLYVLYTLSDNGVFFCKHFVLFGFVLPGYIVVQLFIISCLLLCFWEGFSHLAEVMDLELGMVGRILKRSPQTPILWLFSQILIQELSRDIADGINVINQLTLRQGNSPGIIKSSPMQSHETLNSRGGRQREVSEGRGKGSWLKGKLKMQSLSCDHEAMSRRTQCSMLKMSVGSRVCSHDFWSHCPSPLALQELSVFLITQEKQTTW